MPASRETGGPLPTAPFPTSLMPASRETGGPLPTAPFPTSLMPASRETGGPRCGPLSTAFFPATGAAPYALGTWKLLT
eukprot:366324-Chlamydomonas_euryale.AAC.8